MITKKLQVVFTISYLNAHLGILNAKLYLPNSKTAIPQPQDTILANNARKTKKIPTNIQKLAQNAQKNVWKNKNTPIKLTQSLNPE